MSAWQVVHQYSFYLYVGPIIIFSILYNMPKFYELQVSSSLSYYNLI